MTKEMHQITPKTPIIYHCILQGQSQPIHVLLSPSPKFKSLSLYGVRPAIFVLMAILRQVH